jgi:ribose/xylose/arabinose/galactoside ABC-type transport system permease subunit
MSSRTDRPLERFAETAVLVAVLALTLTLMATLTRGRLLEIRSFEAMAFQMPLLGVLTLAQMLPMLTGGIDLSIISTANLTGILTAMVLTRIEAWYATALGIALGLAAALAAGIANGYIVAIFEVPPIISTLAMMILVKGIALAITRGYVIAGFPDQFLFIGGGSVLGIPMPFVLFGVAATIMSIALSRSPFGISAYMFGSNPVATRFSGIDTRKLLLRTYVVSGSLAGLAGLIMISRFNAAQADYGASFLLLTVLVCVLGGVDPAGGAGRVVDVAVALAILQTVATGFNLLGLSSHLANALWGAILIGVLIVRRSLPTAAVQRP